MPIWPDTRARLLVLAIPVLAGLGWLILAGAPRAYVMVNAGALLVALAAALWLPLPRSHKGEVSLAIALVAVFGLTLNAGYEAIDVRRWLVLGPVRLHAGYLVLPLLTMLAGRLPPRVTAPLLLTAQLMTVIQPDRAAALALSAAIAILAWQRRDGLSLGALVLSLCAVAIVLTQSDALSPVRFVEGVQREALAQMPVLGAVLVLTSLAPLALIRTAAPLSAFLLIAGLAAYIGPYPSILIGYGAAPILGVGLALAALRGHEVRR